MTDENKENKREGNPYIGNVFGWRVSIIGLIVLVILIVFMLLRYNYLKKHDGLKNVQDSVKIENPYREEY